MDLWLPREIVKVSKSIKQEPIIKLLLERDRELLIKFEETRLLGVTEESRRSFAEEHVDEYLNKTKNPKEETSQWK